MEMSEKKKLRFLLEDTKENVKTAIKTLDEALTHIPSERFKLTISLIEQAKTKLNNIIEEIEKQLTEK